MPKRTTRTIPRIRSTILRVTELERRDTPAWWAIAAPTIAGGTPGSTPATITGELTLNPDYEATNGVVTVWADSPVHAATLALAGTMNAKYADHDRAHAFLQENVGDQASDHKSFLVVPNGSGGVDILLEDMAGDPDADYDYNDQTWNDLATPNSSNPIIFEGDFHWTGPSGGVTVHEKVEAVDESTYRWNFALHNDTFFVPWGYGSGGWGVGSVKLPAPSNPQDVTASGSDGGGPGVFQGAPGGGAGTVRFQFSDGMQHPGIMPGGGASMWYETAPRPLADGDGYAWNYPVNYFAGGGVKGPGRNDVRIEITDKTGTPIGADGLKVAKWENAFNVAGGTASVKPVDAVTGLDIIDGDDDRFNVWVYDKAKWDAKTPHIKAKISTDNVVGFTQYNDPASEIDLVRRTDGARPPGWFWSDSQMLVSNAMDDTATIPGVGGDENPLWGLGAPKNGYAWHKADRTHRVALRGTVKAEYLPSVGPAVADTKAVPLKHAVGAHVNILNAPDPTTGLETSVGVLTEDLVDKDFRQANEQFAQVGVLIIPENYGNTQMSWPAAPNKVDLKDGVDMTLVNGRDELDRILFPATKRVHDTVIEVYYVNYFTDGSRGNSYIARLLPANMEFADSSAIAARDRTPFTLGHEIGHVLTNVSINQGHVNTGVWPVNLMRDGTSAANALDASKRLTAAQDTLINTERPKLLKEPI